MTQNEFEEMLAAVAAILTQEVRDSPGLRKPNVFEGRARELLREFAQPKGVDVDPDAHPQVFPDIPVGEFGVEVKVNSSDSWRSVANSVFEGTRHVNVTHIYVLFGKMGGTPEVRWGRRVAQPLSCIRYHHCGCPALAICKGGYDAADGSGFDLPMRDCARLGNH